MSKEQWDWLCLICCDYIQVGFNAGDGRNFYSVPNSQTDAILQINGTTNVRKPGRWMFRIDGKEIEAAGCQNDLDGKLIDDGMAHEKSALGQSVARKSCIVVTGRRYKINELCLYSWYT